jgi:hypothetical protein
MGGVGGRAFGNQTGSPYAQRIVSLCLFYDRVVAERVEAELKRQYAGERSRGGTEWFDMSRGQVVRDVQRICHEMAHHQILSNSAEVPFLHSSNATHFYGLLTFDIVEGEILQYQETDAALDDEIAQAPEDFSKKQTWSLLRGLIQNLCGR